jgi:hypothetical protein
MLNNALLKKLNLYLKALLKKDNPGTDGITGEFYIQTFKE